MALASFDRSMEKAAIPLVKSTKESGILPETKQVSGY
jgi:hypothetical protein